MAAEPARAVLTHPSPGPVKRAQELQKSYVEELKAAQRITFSVDLVLAAKRQLGVLRTIHSLPCLHGGPAVLRAIRRYQNLWMPLVADSSKFDARLHADSKGKCLLPPLDVQWVWHCHCLSPVRYREYCTSKFGRVIDFPLLPDVGSEVLAQERCKRIWSIVYPKEPFDIMATLCKLPGTFGTPNQVVPIEESDGLEFDELVAAVARQSSFYYQVSQPYMWEETFLQAAMERYKCFLHILYKSQGKILCVPTFDIDLMWHSHQLAPVAYAKDTKALLGCIVDHDDTLERGPGTKLGHGFEDTVRLWESTFGHPYERAGSMYRCSKPVNLPAPPASEVTGSTHVLESVPAVLPWDFRIPDHNTTKYPVLTSRHVLQVCVVMKCATNMMPVGRENADLFVRLKVLEAHKSLKLDIPIVPFTPDPQWHKLWLMQCEAKTKGVVLELRYHVEGCLRTLQKTNRIGGARLSWQELQKAPMLSYDTVFTLRKKRFNSHARKHPLQLRLGISITPPVQAPYLLKSVPDRVTDEQGAMVSNMILRMRRYEPQSGRWISRTVLNHAGKEIFVIRIRAAKGVWKKSGDRPVGVDWNERIINVHEGGWHYVANSIGIAPEKIVGTATPLAHELEEYKLSWALSTGDTLIISRQLGDLDWERHLEFTLKTSATCAGLARLLNGRKLQYEVPGATSEEEDGFVTLVRYSPLAPQGKATALFNFKVSMMEVLPEEDVLLVLLLCTATLRSIADFGGLTTGNMYTRQRAKEDRPGLKDWGSVVLENTPHHSNLACWYLNCEEHKHEGEDEGDRENLPARVGGAWESSFRAVDWGGSDQGAKTTGTPTQLPAAAVSHEVAAEATTGAWGRRTGSGIQVDLSDIKRASSIT